MGLIRKMKYFDVSFYVLRRIYFFIKISFNSLDSMIIMAFKRAVLNELAVNGKEKKSKLLIPGTLLKAPMDASLLK